MKKQKQLLWIVFYTQDQRMKERTFKIKSEAEKFCSEVNGSMDEIYL